MPAASAVGLVLLSLAAAGTDLARRRVPNLLTAPAMLAGVAVWTAAEGRDGAVRALAGLAVGLALLIVPWAMGWVGGGDAKFLAAVGALGGPGFVVRAALVGAVLGGVMALAAMARRTPWRRLAAWALSSALLRAGGVRGRPDLGEAGKATIPYAVALAGGVLAALLLDGRG